MLKQLLSMGFQYYFRRSDSTMRIIYKHKTNHVGGGYAQVNVSQAFIQSNVLFGNAWGHLNLSIGSVLGQKCFNLRIHKGSLW